jgi:hypothetical protein
MRPREGRPIATLADARDYALRLDPEIASRSEWQRVAATLLAAAEGGSMGVAHEAVFNALFLNHLLDLKKN